MISEDEESGYSLEFFSQTVTVRRKFEGVDVFKVFPNPFVDQVNFTFTDALKENVKFELYDLSGRLIFEKLDWVDGVFHSLELVQLPAGIYYMSVTIGDDADQVFTLMSGLN